EPIFRWKRTRQKPARCKLLTRARSWRSRRWAVFITATSGAPPERSDAISIHGLVPILAARQDQTSFRFANRRHEFLVLLDGSAHPLARTNDPHWLRGRDFR